MPDLILIRVNVIKNFIEIEQNTISNSEDYIWPMHKHDAQHTGRNPYDISQNKGGLKL